MTVWETLSAIDVSKHVEKKNGFTYLSWAWAWTVLKQHYPSAQYVKHNYSVNGLTVPYMLDRDGHAYVCVTVKIPHNSSDILGHLAEATEVMPVLDHRNKPIKNPDSFAVNASLQRCMSKLWLCLVWVVTSMLVKICQRPVQVCRTAPAINLCHSEPLHLAE